MYTKPYLGQRKPKSADDVVFMNFVRDAARMVSESELAVEKSGNDFRWEMDKLGKTKSDVSDEKGLRVWFRRWGRVDKDSNGRVCYYYKNERYDKSKDACDIVPEEEAIYYKPKDTIFFYNSRSISKEELISFVKDFEQKIDLPDNSWAKSTQVIGGA